jgi:hypothetical protein
VGGIQSVDVDPFEMTMARPSLTAHGHASGTTTAAEQLVELLEELDREGTSVLDLVGGRQTLEAWTLYPDEYGIFDRRTRSQFYFHAHAGAGHEAGHFHTVRLFPDHTAHLVAISMANNGRPQALFTLNLWAIGDRDERPENLKRFAREFRVAEHRGDRRLIRFVNLMFRGFLPEIEWLQDEKARTLARYLAGRPAAEVFEDRSLEIDVGTRATGQRAAVGDA